MRLPQCGFSLVEIMIVLIIIGVLGSIALPYYNDHVTRVQVSELVELMSGVKSPVAEFGASENRWPQLLQSDGSNNVISTSSEIYLNLSGKYSFIDSVISGGPYPSGVITGTMKGISHASGTTLEFLTSDGGSSWICTGGSIPVKFRPHACR